MGTGSSPTFNNVTITGTLSVTGVATFTAQPIMSSLSASQAVFTDSSKGLVSNAITGTGNVVMSASPTLTGTIAAASLSLSSLTAGRVSYSGSAGLQVDSANLLYDGTTFSVNGKLSINSTAGAGPTFTAGIAASDVALASWTRTNNNSSVIKGFEILYTDTTSNALFLPFRISVDGGSTNIFQIGKTGTVTFAGGSTFSATGVLNALSSGTFSNSRVTVGQGLTTSTDGAVYSLSGKSLELVSDAQAGRGIFIQTGTGIVQFAGITSSFPALKRSTTTLAVRLADDSADASLTALNLTASGTVSVPSVITASGNLTLVPNSAITAITGALTVSTNASLVNLTTTATSSTGTAAIIDGSNVLRPLTSSRAFKKNIVTWTPTDQQIGAFLAVKTSVFDYEDHNRKLKYSGGMTLTLSGEDRAGVRGVLGFIVEDLHDAGVTEVLNYDSDGKPYSLREHGVLAYHHEALRSIEQRLSNAGL